MRGAGAHKRGEVQGSRGLLPGGCVACGPRRGKFLLGANHGETVRHTVEASP